MAIDSKRGDGMRMKSLRYSLAMLLLVTTAIGIWLGSMVRDVHQQQRVAAEIEQLGGQFTTGSVSRLPNYRWHRQYLGEAYYPLLASMIAWTLG